MLVLPTFTPVTPNVTLLVPPGIVTDFGALAMLESTPESVTAKPVSAGATSPIVMVTLVVFPTPGAMGFGAMMSVASMTGVAVGVGVLVLVAVGVLLAVGVRVGVSVGVGEAVPV